MQERPAAISHTRPALLAVAAGYVLGAAMACAPPSWSHCQLSCSVEGHCPEGFRCDAASRRCTHPDEGSVCPPGSKGCAAGYEVSADGASCVDTDECAIHNGGCSHGCTDAPVPGDPPTCDCPQQLVLAERGRCGCRPGFELTADGAACRCGDGTPPLSDLSGTLKLWLDGETLPSPGAPLTAWCDRSGQAHHGIPQQAGVGVPQLRVTESGAGLRLDPGEWLITQTSHGAYANEAFQFGTEDFYILWAGGFEDSASPPSSLCLFTTAMSSNDGGLVVLRMRERSDLSVLVLGADDAAPAQVDAEPGTAPLDGRVRLYALQRVGDRLQLRVDGRVVGSASLPEGHDIDTMDDAVIGTCNRSGLRMRGTLFAVVSIVKPSEGDIAEIETFFQNALAQD